MLTNALALTCLLNYFYAINKMFRLDIRTTSLLNNSMKRYLSRYLSHNLNCSPTFELFHNL
jgi:hypothetical protein